MASIVAILESPLEYPQLWDEITSYLRSGMTRRAMRDETSPFAGEPV